MKRTMVLLTIPTTLFFLPLSTFAENASNPKAKYIEVKTLNLKPIFKTQKDWHISAFQSPEAKNDPSEGTASKVCLWSDNKQKEKSCSVIESANEYDPTSTYPHQTISSLGIVQISKTQKAIFLTAQFSGGGSGLLVRNQLWTYDPKQDTFDEILKFNQTEQGESKFLSNGLLTGHLVSADAYWGDGESHFEPHRFTISVYKLNSNENNNYTKILTYITTKKYPSLDNGALNVVTPELPTTISKLKAVYGAKLSPL